MSDELNKKQDPEMVEMPAPTVWPFITAFGITLVFAGLITHGAVTVVGLGLALRGAVGWFREVLPVPKTERVRVRPEEPRALAIPSSSPSVAYLNAGEAGHRVRIPEKYHPYSAGIIGGIFGGVAMAVVACTYGLIAQGSLWDPINLLAAAALPSLAQASLAQLKAFNGTGFVTARAAMEPMDAWARRAR